MRPQNVVLKMSALAALLLLTALLVIYQTNSSQQVAPQLGEEFELSLGESIELQDVDVHVEFTEVVEDSRCPEGVVCVWEGRVIIALNVTVDGQEFAVTLRQPSDSEGSPSLEIGGKIITLVSLKPHPVLNPPQDTPPKTVRLVVTSN